MIGRPIRMLLLEDNPGDANLVRTALGKVDESIKIEHVDRVSAAEARLRDASDPIDAVLADLGLPDSFGLETVTRLQAAAPDIPIVVLTGTFEEKMGTEAVQAGAQDYFIKEELAGRPVARALRYAIERKAVQRALADANRELTRARDELERRVEERTAEIKRANQDLETMLYVATHDLREPLNSIQWFSQMIQERRGEDLDENTRDKLDRMHKAAERMTKLLDGLLVLARARRIEAPDEVVATGEVVRDVVEQYDQRIRDLGARVVMTANLPKLNVHRTWVVEVVSNLLSNALKFTRPGAAPDVEIDRYDGPEGVGLVVRDRGPGVPEGLEDRVFHLFQRAVGREIDGTGAGLAIVRQIAERYGGKAWVARREGGGSEFTVAFKSNVGEARTRRLNLLLVDDDHDYIYITQEMLSASPLVAHIDVAMNGVEALACLKKANGYREAPTPDLVLLDLNMPRKNGFEVLMEMRMDPALSAIPVAVVTASVRKEDEDRARAGGAVAFLSKPLRTEHLLRIVEGVR